MGAYELLGLLGAGGAARVYLARRPAQPGHLLALKVFAEELTIAPARWKVLRMNVGVATRSAHPAMVRTYEVGEADSHLFVAMELIQGWSLRDLRKACPFGLPPRALIAIQRQVVRGLHPGNVMVTVDGGVRVLDLGAAPQFASRRVLGAPHVGKRDTELLRSWITHIEPRLPPLTVPGFWGKAGQPS